MDTNPENTLILKVHLIEKQRRMTLLFPHCLLFSFNGIEFSRDRVADTFVSGENERQHDDIDIDIDDNQHTLRAPIVSTTRENPYCLCVQLFVSVEVFERFNSSG